MCSKLSLLFFLLIVKFSAQAQDVIHLMDGTEQKAIVKTVTPHIIPTNVLITLTDLTIQ